MYSVKMWYREPSHNTNTWWHNNNLLQTLLQSNQKHCRTMVMRSYCTNKPLTGKHRTVTSWDKTWRNKREAGLCSSNKQEKSMYLHLQQYKSGLYFKYHRFYQTRYISACFPPPYKLAAGEQLVKNQILLHLIFTWNAECFLIYTEIQTSEAEQFANNKNYIRPTYTASINFDSYINHLDLGDQRSKVKVSPFWSSKSKILSFKALGL